MPSEASVARTSFGWVFESIGFSWESEDGERRAQACAPSPRHYSPSRRRATASRRGWRRADTSVYPVGVPDRLASSKRHTPAPRRIAMRRSAALAVTFLAVVLVGWSRAAGGEAPATF